jgi:ABC-2 type transport system ATP-binding protein
MSVEIEVSNTPAIAVKNLTKIYRTGFWLNQQVNSLKSCTLDVQQGETFGLLGANGAGKTTLLKLLLGIVQPTSGSAKLLGFDLGDRISRQKIGYLPENAYYYDYLTGWELLDFIGNIFGMESRVKTERIAELLDLVGLAQSTARKKQIRTYSKGMVQRVGLAQALINDPQLVFLDEPMSGLDPVGRYQIREIILALKQQGKTVFFNSHILSDVELICDRIGILHKGELMAAGTLNQLLGTNQNFQVSGNGGSYEQLQTWIEHLEFQNQSWHGTLIGDSQAFLNFLTEINANLVSMNLSRQTLEEFFIALVHAQQS